MEILTHAKYPQYALLSERLRSFDTQTTGWQEIPFFGEIRMTVANAGFFRSPVDATSTHDIVCHFCGCERFLECTITHNTGCWYHDDGDVLLRAIRQKQHERIPDILGLSPAPIKALQVAAVELGDCVSVQQLLDCGIEPDEGTVAATLDHGHLDCAQLMWAAAQHGGGEQLVNFQNSSAGWTVFQHRHTAKKVELFCELLENCLDSPVVIPVSDDWWQLCLFFHYVDRRLVCSHTSTIAPRLVKMVLPRPSEHRHAEAVLRLADKYCVSWLSREMISSIATYLASFAFTATKDEVDQRKEGFGLFLALEKLSSDLRAEGTWRWGPKTLAALRPLLLTQEEDWPEEPAHVPYTIRTLAHGDCAFRWKGVLTAITVASLPRCHIIRMFDGQVFFQVDAYDNDHRLGTRCLGSHSIRGFAHKQKYRWDPLWKIDEEIRSVSDCQFARSSGRFWVFHDELQQRGCKVTGNFAEDDHWVWTKI